MDPRSLRDLWTCLRGDGYTADGIGALADGAITERALLRYPGLTCLLHRDDLLRGPEPAGVLLAMCWFGMSVPIAAYKRLSVSTRTVLEALRWVVSDGASVRTTVAITTFADALFVSDCMMRVDGDAVTVPTDKEGTRVMPPSISSMELWDAVAGDIDGPYLDVGCGCGVHALLAAAGGAVSEGVDISPRASAFARLNAALNDADVSFDQGDAVAAIASRTFSHMTFNMPWGLAYDETNRGAFKPSTDYVADFLADAIDGSIAPGARVALFAVLELTAESADDPLATITRRLSGASQLTVDVAPLPTSAYRLSRDAVANGIVPAGYAALRRSGDRARLLEYLRTRRVVEVRPCVITACQAD